MVWHRKQRQHPNFRDNSMQCVHRAAKQKYSTDWNTGGAPPGMSRFCFFPLFSRPSGFCVGPKQAQKNICDPFPNPTQQVCWFQPASKRTPAPKATHRWRVCSRPRLEDLPSLRPWRPFCAQGLLSLWPCPNGEINKMGEGGGGGVGGGGGKCLAKKTASWWNSSRRSSVEPTRQKGTCRVLPLN